MEITRRSVNVTVDLPVQYNAIENGGELTVYNISIAGLYSLFDNLPEGVKLQVSEQVARQARGIK